MVPDVMHYYQFNIGNYRRQTHHLSVLEHGVYRMLLDTYYLEEKPLCRDKAKLMRTHNIRTQEEKEAFENVISDFFRLTEHGYTHDTCEEKIAKYQQKSKKASQSAKARWGKDANALQPQSEGNANQEPLTKNQEPDKPFCPEPAAPVPFITLTLNDKSEFPITESQLAEWQELYPAVDIRQELRNMRGWCNSNPTKRKTRKGILRFVTSWLAREQNRGGQHAKTQQPRDTRTPLEKWQAKYDAGELG